MTAYTLAHSGAFSQRLPTRLYARPYGMCRSGFYFTCVEEFNTQAHQVIDGWGETVEFNIRFIDGSDLDAALFKALSIDQSTLDKFFEFMDQWSKDEKIQVIITLQHCGRRFDFSKEPKTFAEENGVEVYSSLAGEDMLRDFYYIDSDGYPSYRYDNHEAAIVTNEIHRVYRTFNVTS